MKRFVLALTVLGSLAVAVDASAAPVLRSRSTTFTLVSNTLNTGGSLSSILPTITVNTSVFNQSLEFRPTLRGLLTTSNAVINNNTFVVNNPTLNVPTVTSGYTPTTAPRSGT